MLHRANIAALNNVMALGSQVQPSTTPIRIDIPPMLDDDDDGADGDEDIGPLNPEELRARAERTLQNFKSGKANAGKNNRNTIKRGNKK